MLIGHDGPQVAFDLVFICIDFRTDGVQLILGQRPALVAAVCEAMSVVDLLAMELRTVLRRMA